MPLCWPTGRQDVSKMANLEPKIGNLELFWEHLGDFFGILGAILPKLMKTSKARRVEHFLRFLGVLGMLLEAMSAHLGAMLFYVAPVVGRCLFSGFFFRYFQGFFSSYFQGAVWGCRGQMVTCWAIWGRIYLYVYIYI